MAAQRGHPQTIGTLIDGGARANIQTGEGYSALYLAVIGEHKIPAKMLLAAGADCNLKTKKGETVLHAAIDKKREDIVDLLLK